MDDAWTALTSHTHIRLTAEELKSINETSIALSDEAGGYLAGLGIYVFPTYSN
jgi:hypothetical protein